MIAYQLTVPVENAPGRLAQVSSILAREKINLRAITISSFGDKGYFNILVDDPKFAHKVLTKNGITAELTEIIAVLIDDRPGGMDQLLQVLAQEGINVENAYGFVLESSKNAVFVIDVSDIKGTESILKKHHIKTLTPEALANIEPFHYMKY